MKANTNFIYLPLTLSIKTLGGIASPLILRGTPLPTKRQQIFSTSADNQNEVILEVYLGESPLAAKNIHVGSVQLTGIPKAPRGEPKIEVTFEVNMECKIKVTAREKQSGTTISSDMEDTAPHLTAANIQDSLLKSNDSREQDQEVASRIEVRNEANTLIGRAEKYLQDRQKLGLAAKEIEDTLATLGLALQAEDLAAIKQKSKRIEQLLPNTAFGNLGDLFPDGMFSNFFGPARQGSAPEGHPVRSMSKKGRDSASPPSKATQTQELAESQKGLFEAGQYFDAKSLVTDLLHQAKHDILIIDRYAGENLLCLLTVKLAVVRARLLTGKVRPALLTLAREFNRQYKGLEIRSSDAFHDRFIIIDDTHFYHFGASIEHLGNKAFMFSKIEEPSIITALRECCEKEWGKAKELVT